MKSLSLLFSLTARVPQTITTRHCRCGIEQIRTYNFSFRNMSAKRAAIVDLTSIDDDEASDEVVIEQTKKKMKATGAAVKHQSSLHGFFVNKNAARSSPNGAARNMSSETKQQKFKVYCDLDGVLCDFEAGVKKIFGKGPSALPPGLLWSGINRSEKFYETLLWMPDGKELWEKIRHLQPDILTGVPGSRKSSRVEKANWCATELGMETNHVDYAAPKRQHEVVQGRMRKEEHIVNVITCWSKNKHHKSGPGKVLIDDTEALMSDWCSKGGIFILHTDTKSTIQKLKSHGIIASAKEESGKKGSNSN
mmetsp:Transcript_23750/g.36646  ORF Transcript_23750/g.36646 Transcript_23750/m.36646 type:complete len:307 (+) Transcript_23750:38-958(+)